MAGGRLWTFLAGGLLVVIPSVAGVYNGSTFLGVVLMLGAVVAQYAKRGAK
jgi:hypothetical protein